MQKHYYKLFLHLFKFKNLQGVNLCDIGNVWMAYMRPWDIFYKNKSKFSILIKINLKNYYLNNYLFLVFKFF